MQQKRSYDKIQATVVSVDRVDMVCLTEDGRTIRVQKAYRSGKGHHSEIRPGLKIKLYQRPGEPYFRYRFIGG